jgi:hypothetical protein
MTTFTKSDSIDALASALIRAQKGYTPAKRNQTADDGRRYADIASILDACRKPLARHGLTVVQFSGMEAVETIICHDSGQFLAGRTATKTALESGETIYGPRHALMHALGVVEEPDVKASSPEMADILRELDRLNGMLDPKVMEAIERNRLSKAQALVIMRGNGTAAEMIAAADRLGAQR